MGFWLLNSILEWLLGSINWLIITKGVDQGTGAYPDLETPDQINGED